MPFLLLCIIVLASGCYSPPPQPASASPAPVEARSNAASLLYDLLGDEKNVSKLLIIKRDRRELHDVIKKISSTADEARKSLEKLAREDSTLSLQSKALPPGETATRESESKARGKELLHASGADLEFKLLLTQAEALAYAEHLATVAAEREPRPDHAKIFTEISSQMKARHKDVVDLLRAPPPSAK